MNKLDRILKYLWLFNGIIFLIWGWFSIYPQLLRLFKPRPSYKPAGVIVGKTLDEATKKGTELQAIQFESPTRIEKNKYLIIPVSQKDYTHPRPTAQQRRGADWRQTYYRRIGLFNNLIFMPEDGYSKHLLFQNKVAITAFSVPVGDAGNVIYYRVIEKDTNGDDRLDYSDEYSIYTSDLTGNHLAKFVTPPGVLRYVYPLLATGDLIVLLTRDSDKDGRYTEYDDDFVYKLELQTKTIKQIVRPELIHDIRDIIEN